MCKEFRWTAKFFADGKAVEAKYFETQAERDVWVSSHDGWKKRGKICAENLEKHLEEGNRQRKLRTIKNKFFHTLTVSDVILFESTKKQKKRSENDVGGDGCISKMAGQGKRIPASFMGESRAAL